MRFAVVIPTYQRRNVVVRTVAALDRQTHRDFEVVVAVDGSTDGTAAALRELGVGFPLTVLEMPNGGASAARNAGAAAAAGDVLLFLDDDMEADPELLAEHDAAIEAGADLVLGDLPLHPDSPPNLLSWGVGFWADARRERLASSGAPVPVDDILTGQLSIRRHAFERLGGFDSMFTRDGTFGGEDIDFGQRALAAGLRIVFNPRAVSYQYYDVDPALFLRRSFEGGRAAQELVAKHPERAEQLAGPRFWKLRSRATFGVLATMPSAFSAPLRVGAAALVRRGRRDDWLRRFFFALRTTEHLRGMRAAQTTRLGSTIAVLAYHAATDLTRDPVLAEYGIPPERIAAQADALAAHGWVPVSVDDFLAWLAGRRPLPPRAFVVTFDDAYRDVDAAVAILAERSVAPAVFAVSRLVGRTNSWDERLGAQALELLDADGLRALSDRGIEIGSHGATHRPLDTLERSELEVETTVSRDELASLGLPPPRTFSYPYGAWNDAAASAVQGAGYAAAFTIETALVDCDSSAYALPRVEIFARDSVADVVARLESLAKRPRRGRRWVERAGAALASRTEFEAPARRARLALASEALAPFADISQFRVLDAGCGDGLGTLALARAHPRWRFVGLDIRANLIEGARRRAVARGLENVRFVEADLTEPLPVGDFDAVLAIECLEEIPDDEAAIASLAGALVPGGTLLVHVPEASWTPILPGSPNIWRDEVRHGYTSAGLAVALERAGLDDVRVQGSFRGTAVVAQEIRDRIKGARVLVRAAAFPIFAAAASLERLGVTAGRPRALFAVARRPGE